MLATCSAQNLNLVVEGIPEDTPVDDIMVLGSAVHGILIGLQVTEGSEEVVGLCGDFGENAVNEDGGGVVIVHGDDVFMRSMDGGGHVIIHSDDVFMKTAEGGGYVIVHGDVFRAINQSPFIIQSEEEDIKLEVSIGGVVVVMADNLKKKGPQSVDTGIVIHILTKQAFDDACVAELNETFANKMLEEVQNMGNFESATSVHFE